MTGEHWLMLILFVTNTLIVLLYILIQFFRKKENSRGYLLKAFIMFICPVAGPIFFIGSQIFYLIFFKMQSDLEDVVFSKNKIKQHVRADEEEGHQLAPMEEALAVSDTGSLRRLMLNVVRGDMRKSLAAIALALNSEDSETSHYAASVLQDELNSFRSNVQKVYLEIKNSEEEIGDMCMTLLDYMDQVLRQNVFTDMEQRSYVLKMEEVGDILYEKDRDKMTGTQYENICLRLLGIKAYELCDKWCIRGKEQFPNTLSSYTCMLKLYFSSGQKEKFFLVMDELKKSNIVVDNETLELIRIFS